MLGNGLVSRVTRFWLFHDNYLRYETPVESAISIPFFVKVEFVHIASKKVWCLFYQRKQFYKLKKFPITDWD